MSGPLFLVALFVAGAVGGAINSVAGGGSFIVFPTLLLGGIGPVVANATTAAGLWVAGIGSVGAYRQNLPKNRTTLVVLGIMSAAGGGLGAVLLLVTSDRTFAKILPLLMLAAAVVFTLGPRVTRAGRSAHLPLAVGAVAQLAIATYGGYFGGGMGIMMLAVFTLMGMTDIHEMNAIKVVAGLLINGVAVAGFLLAQKVILSIAAPVAVGAIAGGWGGAWLARRIDAAYVRRFVLVVAWSLTAWFAYRSLLK